MWDTEYIVWHSLTTPTLFTLLYPPAHPQTCKQPEGAAFCPAVSDGSDIFHEKTGECNPIWTAWCMCKKPITQLCCHPAPQRKEWSTDKGIPFRSAANPCVGCCTLWSVLFLHLQPEKGFSQERDCKKKLNETTKMTKWIYSFSVMEITQFYKKKKSLLWECLPDT